MSKKLICTLLLLISPGLLLANPMRPDPIKPSVSTSQPKKVVRAPRLPKLEQVMIIGEYRVATFNGGQDILLGDSISGYIVSEIHADHVILVRDKKNTRIDLENTGSLKITPATEE